MKTKTSKLISALLVASLSAAYVPAAAQETVWNVSLWGKRRAFTENVEKLAELVEQKTNGAFKLNLSYGGLSKARENLDGISIGAFEMAQFCAFYHPDKNPTITVMELPFVEDVDLARITDIYQEVFRHPAVAQDMARWNATLLMPSPMPQYNIVGKDPAPKSLDDFDGVRVRGPGGLVGVLEKYGAVRTGVPFAEVRQSMDSGVIDAAAFAPHAHLATQTFKVGGWATTNLNLGTANCPVVVNTDALNALPPAHREALLGSVDEALAFYVDNYNSGTTGKYDAALQTEGVELVTFTDAQQAQLDKTSADVRRAWVEKHAGDFNSQELFDYTRRLFAE